MNAQLENTAAYALVIAEGAQSQPVNATLDTSLGRFVPQ